MMLKVLSVLFLAVVVRAEGPEGPKGPVVCCSQLQNFQGYTNLYLGYVDLTQLPGTPPEAYVGTARVTSKYTDRKMLTEYLDWDIPGFEETAAILGDYSENPAKIYDIYKNGTCLYTEYEDIFMTPACVPPTWKYIGSFYMGLTTDNILVDRYGDVQEQNYINVLSSNCQPLVNLATRRNKPTDGIYRFNTEFYMNVTAYSGAIDIPAGCQPHTALKSELPEFIPMRELTLKRETKMEHKFEPKFYRHDNKTPK